MFLPIYKGIAGDPILKELQDLSEEENRKLDFFKRQAEQLVAANVTLIDETQDDDAILAALKGSPAGQARGDTARRTHVLIYYDQQDVGEASSQPHLRVPPLRSKGQHLQRFLRLVMRRTENQDDLDDADIYTINDAGRSGNKSVILGSFLNSLGQALICHNFCLRMPSLGAPHKS